MRSTYSEKLADSGFPRRVAVLGGLAVAGYLAAIWLPTGELKINLQWPLYSLVLGSGFYLLSRGSWSILAGLALISLMALAQSANALAALSRVTGLGGLRLEESLRLLSEHSLLSWAAIGPGLVALMGLVAVQRRGCAGSYKFLAGLAVSLALAVHISIWHKNGLTAYGSQFLLTTVYPLAVSLLAVVPAAMAVRAVGETIGQTLEVSIGARLWCALVVLLSAGALAFNAMNRLPGLPLALLGLPAIVGMFTLLFGSRSGFYLALTGVLLICVHLLLLLPQAGDRWPILAGALMAALLNPAITWLLIRRAPLKVKIRPDYGQAYLGLEPVARRRLPVVIPLLETLGMLCGLFLAALGLAYLNRGNYATANVVGFGLGVGLALLEGTAAILGFKKRGPAALHGLCLMLVAAIAALVALGLVARFTDLL